MNIYKGYSRRQVGGNIWSTIQRGIRPIILNLISKLKPQAVKAGKSLAKRAANSALTIGSNVAMNAISGNLNKRSIKSVVSNEVNNLKSDAKSKIDSLKRSYLDTNENDEQEGKGYKHRRKEKNINILANTKEKTLKGKSKAKGRPKAVVDVSKKKVINKEHVSKKVINKGRVSKKVINKGVKKVINKGCTKKKKSSVNINAIKDIFN